MTKQFFPFRENYWNNDLEELKKKIPLDDLINIENYMNNEWKLEKCDCLNKQYCNHSYSEIFKNLIREKIINKSVESGPKGNIRMNIPGNEYTWQ